MVRLLADRVSAARGGAELTPAELTTAAGLCRRLDGLPLAIEQAATRLRALPLSEIMSRLDHIPLWGSFGRAADHRPRD